MTKSINRLEIIKASNGGWIILGSHDDIGLLRQPEAAYSTTADLLNGLSEMLEEKPIGNEIGGEA